MDSKKQEKEIDLDVDVVNHIAKRSYMQDKEEEEEEESNDNIDEKYKAYEDGADFAKRKYTP